MILMAWIFGWLAGAGLPPTATYIIGAVVIVPPMKQLGIDPWVAHFFVFLLSVWGELSPPTSLTAAVSARIANASFLGTMMEALKICAPITLMTFAIFTRSNMVVNQGWMQIADTLLTLISTLGIAFAMFGRCHRNVTVDILLRCLMAAISFATTFHSDTMTAAGYFIGCRRRVGFGIIRHRQIGAEGPVATGGGTGYGPGRTSADRGRGATRHRMRGKKGRRLAALSKRCLCPVI